MTPEELKARAEPIDRLGDPAFREVLKQSAVVYGLDESRDALVLMHGREILEEIARGEKDIGPIGIAVVKFLPSTEQADYLASAVKLLKGSCCYQPPAEES